MNHLLRDLAPVTDAGWDQLEDEARRQLGSALAARKLVDFSGPHGWEHSATGLGRVETVPKALVEGVTPLRRSVLPLVEPRADFTVARPRLVAECSHPRGPTKSTSLRAASADVRRCLASLSRSSQPESVIGASERRRWFIRPPP